MYKIDTFHWFPSEMNITVNYLQEWLTKLYSDREENIIVKRLWEFLEEILEN